MSSNETAAWRHPVHGAMVIMPDGHTMTAAKASKQGHDIIPWPDDVARVATPHPHEAERVILPRGAEADRKRAIEAGFTVSEVAAPASNAVALADSWRMAILYSPEARERKAAAEEIVNMHAYHTMTVEAARSFLRGLPNEQSTEEQPTVTKTEDPRAARKAEIAASMNSFNRDRGFAARQPTPAAGPALADIDPAKLKRIAELRAAALAPGNTVSDEAKKIRYALSVHDSTGMPLARAFAQLGVDTSKFTF